MYWFSIISQYFINDHDHSKEYLDCILEEILVEILVDML